MTAESTLLEPIIEQAGSSPPAIRLVSVVVPVVERADDLLALRRAFAGALTQRGIAHEFLFVFDGGFSPSAELLELARADPSVRLLSFARTFGETAALGLGFERSHGDVILTLPAYFQVKAEGLGPMLDTLQAGADLVVANRSPRVDSWLNRVQTRAFHRLVSGVTDRQLHDMACGVRLIRRTVAEALPLYGDLHRFIPALALREGFRVEEVAVPQHANDARMRIYGPGVYLRRLLDISAFFFLAKFTEKPLRFFGLVGSACFGLGAVTSIILFVQRVGGQAIANRPLLLLAVLLVALGIQLLGLGLVGEIIVHLRSPHRRAYRIRERA